MHAHTCKDRWTTRKQCQRSNLLDRWRHKSYSDKAKDKNLLLYSKTKHEPVVVERRGSSEISRHRRQSTRRNSEQCAPVNWIKLCNQHTTTHNRNAESTSFPFDSHHFFVNKATRVPDSFPKKLLGLLVHGLLQAECIYCCPTNSVKSPKKSEYNQLCD